MNTLLRAIILAAGLCAGPQPGQPQQGQTPKTQAPAKMSDMHQQGVNERGDKVMGFSHEKTMHHFRLYSDGGAIEAEAKSAQDTVSRDQIREHFVHIVKMFAAGDFNAPMLIHGQNPPGTSVMARMKEQIRYTLTETPRGARLRITTQNADTLMAVHEFLRFQIRDHQTGDSMEVTQTP